MHVIPFHTQLKNYAFCCGILNGHFVVSGMFNLLTAGNSYTETDNSDEAEKPVFNQINYLEASDIDWSCTFWI